MSIVTIHHSVLRKFCRAKWFDGKKHTHTHLLRTENSTTDTKKRKDVSCYMLDGNSSTTETDKKTTTAATYWKQYN